MIRAVYVCDNEAGHYGDFKKFALIEIILSEFCNPQVLKDFQVAKHCFNK
jgi:hypothetical protein